MSRPYSPELQHLAEEAIDSSEQLGEPLSSLHLLFALFMLDNSGALLLSEEGINEGTLLPHVDRSLRESEDAADELMNYAEEAAALYRNPEVNCLHLVVALCRHRQSLAYRTLEKANVPISRLRNRAVSLLVNPMPRKYVSLFESQARQSRRAEAAPPTTPQPRRPAESRAAAGTVPVEPARTVRTVTHRTAGSPLPGGSLLAEVAVDLVEEAAAGRLHEAIGREKELSELADILNKRNTNNPLVIGPPGSGKTALIEGLAWRLARDPESLPGLDKRRIFRLEPSRLLQGTYLRGTFAERMTRLRSELAKANGHSILFVDDLHTLIQGSVDGSQEIAQELKSALGAGEFPCIAISTPADHRRFIEKDPALSRRFHVIELNEPDEASTLEILNRHLPLLEEHHQVHFEPGVLSVAVRLGNRHLRERSQPDKTLSVLDLAGSRARRAGCAVTARLVAEAVSQLSQIPVEQLVVEEAQRYLDLENRISKRIVGHRDVLVRIAEALRRNVAGFSGDRPMGSFLFAGPTGVGKTEIARALAEELFGSREAMTRIDMSEFSEPHSVAKLIGAPPGYVGFEEGGILTGAIRRRPFQIVLFDEFEKANLDVHQLLLQVLDEGRLTDSLGRSADFTHAVVIMTSNLGSEAFEKSGRAIGFSSEDPAARTEREVLEAVRRALSPELYNRIDEKIVFTRLSEDQVRSVASLMLESSRERLRKGKEIEILVDESVPEALVRNGGYDPRYGARPMRRAIQSLIEGPLAAKILKGELQAGDKVKVIPDGKGGFRFEKKTRRSQKGGTA